MKARTCISFLLVLTFLMSAFSVTASVDTGFQFSEPDSNGMKAGNYISFSPDSLLRDLPFYLEGPDMSDASLVHEVSLLDTVIFDSISFSAMGNVTLEQMGAAFVFDGTGGVLELHDTPTGSIIFAARTNGTLSLVVADDISVRMDNNTIVLDRDGTFGRAFLTGGNMSIDGQKITVSLPENGRFVWRSLPYLFYDGEEMTVLASIVSGKVAGELYVFRDGEFVREDYADYSGATVSLSMVSSEQIGLAVAGSSGKLVIVHIPQTTLSNPSVIEVDGKEAAPAPSLGDILSYSGSPPASYIADGANSTAAFVYLSDAGEHYVMISGEKPKTLSAGDYLTISIAGSVIALAALLLFRRS